MSHLTDLDMHDRFAKPQSNGAALHSALFRRNKVEQNRLEKNKILKKRTANVLIFGAEGVMWTCHGCNQTALRLIYVKAALHTAGARKI